MKQIFFLLFLLISIQSFSQKYNYKVGIITSLPADIYGDSYRVGIGSGFFEVSRFVSKKIDVLANSGYVRFMGEGSYKFAQIPALVGVKYKLNDKYYFGASSGISIYNKKQYGEYNWTFSPFVGMNFKKISVDVRYWNSINSEIPPKSLTAVFSYTL